jgi:hypothetical protein
VLYYHKPGKRTWKTFRAKDAAEAFREGKKPEGLVIEVLEDA